MKKNLFLLLSCLSLVIGAASDDAFAGGGRKPRKGRNKNEQKPEVEDESKIEDSSKKESGPEDKSNKGKIIATIKKGMPKVGAMKEKHDAKILEEGQRILGDEKATAEVIRVVEVPSLSSGQVEKIVSAKKDTEISKVTQGLDIDFSDSLAARTQVEERLNEMTVALTAMKDGTKSRKRLENKSNALKIVVGALTEIKELGKDGGNFPAGNLVRVICKDASNVLDGAIKYDAGTENANYTDGELRRERSKLHNMLPEFRNAYTADEVGWNKLQLDLRKRNKGFVAAQAELAALKDNAYSLEAISQELASLKKAVKAKMRKTAAATIEPLITPVETLIQEVEALKKAAV